MKSGVTKLQSSKTSINGSDRLQHKACSSPKLDNCESVFEALSAPSLYKTQLERRKLQPFRTEAFHALVALSSWVCKLRTSCVESSTLSESEGHRYHNYVYVQLRFGSRIVPEPHHINVSMSPVATQFVQKEFANSVKM